MLNERVLRTISDAARDSYAPKPVGRVSRIAGLLIEATVPGAAIGDVVEIQGAHNRVVGEVVGFRDTVANVMPFSELRGLRPGARVTLTSRPGIPVGDGLLGRIIDSSGAPIDGRGPVRCARHRGLHSKGPAIFERDLVRKRFDTGVRSIDGLLTCGRGQRIGVFAGAGVGKSVLVDQIATHSTADVTVIGLIGERGREVRELLDKIRGENTVVVAATSDRSPMERIRGALAATTVAEDFRDRGRHVLLVIDSITRYAMAWREVGLAAGEPPASKGYPPSVFAELPRLLERVSPLAGGGSITGFYTVLVEGDDLSDPVADSARSLLDGHIVLSRSLAAIGHFPAIDIAASASRVARQVADVDSQKLALRTRQVLAMRSEAQELRSLGAYSPGSDPRFDEACAVGERLDTWMRQGPDECSPYSDTMRGLGQALGPDNRK